MGLLLIIAVGLLYAILLEFRARSNLRPFWRRPCTVAQWRRRFPVASKSEVRRFLDLFVDAFDFARRRRLSFAPDDRVMDVYKAMYSPRWNMADDFELEEFVIALEDSYRIDLDDFWDEDVTLGELFQHLHSRPAP